MVEVLMRPQHIEISAISFGKLLQPFINIEVLIKLNYKNNSSRIISKSLELKCIENLFHYYFEINKLHQSIF